MADPLLGSSYTLPSSAPVPGYRPPQWGNGFIPALTILTPGTTPSQYTVSQKTGDDGDPVFVADGTTQDNPPVLYVFDTALHASHDQELEITKNPIQTGASVQDHAYLEPARLTVEIFMSDVMQSYVLGQFSGTQARSVSAYQTLLALQASVTLLQVATRLRQYDNMLVHSIRAEESNDTRHALRCSVTFEEALLAGVESSSAAISTSSNDSARPQATGSSPSGRSQTAPVTSVITNNYNVLAHNFERQGVAGAGQWSSINVQSLENVLTGISRY